MAKRLTDSNKWNDEWFSELPADMKLVWLYLLDACDHAGVYKPSLKTIKFYTGTDRSLEDIIEYLKERIYIADNNKWFIPKFVTFQYKNFFTNNAPAVKSARELLLSHSIIKPNDNTLPTVSKGLDNPYTTLTIPYDKDYIRAKDMDKDNDMNINKDKATDNVRDIVLEVDKVKDINKMSKQEISQSFDELFNTEN